MMNTSYFSVTTKGNCISRLYIVFFYLSIKELIENLLREEETKNYVYYTNLSKHLNFGLFEDKRSSKSRQPFAYEILIPSRNNKEVTVGTDT